MVTIELTVVAILIVINGFLAMAELAIVSSRPARLKMLADQGIGGARRALALSENPGRFLSTVQIGITLVGVLSGAFSGATLGMRFTQWLAAAGLSPTAAETIGVGTVVVAITYFSLIIGELVPKQLALRNAEGMAVKVAPAMTIIAKVAAPLVTVLDLSGRIVLRLFGRPVSDDDRITDEEIKTLIAEAEGEGVLESAERRMISGVMRLGDRPIQGVMTPRTEVDWLDLTTSEEELRRVLITTQHSRLPAGDAIDELVGVVQAREMLAAMVEGKPLDLRAHIRAAPIVYDTVDALDVLATLRDAAVPMALVHDEYGHFEGIATPADIFETITGVFRADTEEHDPPAFRREDGSWLLAGYIPADEMAEHLGFALPQIRDYQTLAGFMLAQLQHMPSVGDAIDAQDWRFEVVDIDGRRIDKVLAVRKPRRGIAL
jgi:putative hemolysin